MAKTRRMARNQNHDDASNGKTCDNGGAAPWLDLNHDVLLLVMMKMGVIDFVAFSGVCKLWRSFALSNRKKFMASRPPMSLMIKWNSDAYKKECCLEDFEGRKFITLLPERCLWQSDHLCFGTTCGYLVLFEWKIRDFWLVNPITRHELHFPSFPGSWDVDISLRGILVFSLSINEWVFIVVSKYNSHIWFSIAGTREWNHISSDFTILDLHAFKGKIYFLINGWHMHLYDWHMHLCELRLNLEPNLILLEIKNFPEPRIFDPEFVSSGENLFVIEKILYPQDLYKVQEVDIGEMKWLSLPQEKIAKEYAFFLSDQKNSAAIKPESWAGPRSQYKSFHDKIKSENRFSTKRMWYFPHDCLNVNIVNE